MLDYFPDLWNALSRGALEDKKLQQRLVGSHQPELPPPLSASITDYPGTKGRNVFQSELKHITELVIDDIPESAELEKDFLTKCYCHSGALSQHSLASKAILRARYSALFDSSSPGRPALVSATTRWGVTGIVRRQHEPTSDTVAGQRRCREVNVHTPSRWYRGTRHIRQSNFHSH